MYFLPIAKPLIFRADLFLLFFLNGLLLYFKTTLINYEFLTFIPKCNKGNF